MYSQLINLHINRYQYLCFVSITLHVNYIIDYASLKLKQNIAIALWYVYAMFLCRLFERSIKSIRYMIVYN